MEINSPVEMIKAIDMLILQMDRPHRKQFLAWVKNRRNQYDLLYPMGWKPPEEESKPSILVPDNVKDAIIIPEGVKTNEKVPDANNVSGSVNTAPISPA